MARPRPAGRHLSRDRARARFGLLVVIILAIVALLVSRGGPGPIAGAPRPGPVTAAPGDLFGFSSAQTADFVARATAGNGHVLFVKSPGGAVATAARVAALRPAIDRATAGTGIDPALLEGLVFVESAGRPQVIAGSDPADAAGLTQILAATGQTMLGMHIDLTASRQLTERIAAAAAAGRSGLVAGLERQRAAADDRFDIARELAGTVRYLQLAEQRFGRIDLAVESYHMGIGNLQTALADDDGGAPISYARLYFDSGPTRHRATFDLFSSLSDDSPLYLWRVLGAVSIMRLYRTDRAALARLSALQTADDRGAEVLHPPGSTPVFGGPAALSAAYRTHRLVPLPTDLAADGLAASPGLGSDARRLDAPASLYRGLTSGALRTLLAIGRRVRALSGARTPLEIATATCDLAYQRRVLGVTDPSLATGWTLDLARRYSSPAQAQALQEVLDRLQSLNLIAWAPEGPLLRITIASDAAAWLSRE
jgi:hypothetical protein